MEGQSEASEDRDAEIVGRILAGESSAVERLLIEDCGAQLGYLVRVRYASLGMELGELVSELYLRLRANNWAALKAYRGENGTGASCRLKSYIVLIAARMLAKIAARKNADARRLIALDETDVTAVEDSDSVRERTATELLETLLLLDDPDDRAVLFFYKIEGRRAEEVADRLHISLENVYTRTSRALGKLRALMLKEGADV